MRCLMDSIRNPSFFDKPKLTLTAFRPTKVLLAHHPYDGRGRCLFINRFTKCTINPKTKLCQGFEPRSAGLSDCCNSDYTSKTNSFASQSEGDVTSLSIQLAPSFASLLFITHQRMASHSAQDISPTKNAELSLDA